MGKAANSVKIETVEAPEAPTEAISLYLLPPVGVWNETSEQMVRLALPKLQVVILDSQAPLEPQIKLQGASVLLCEAKTKDQIASLLQLIRSFALPIKQKTLTISAVSAPSSSETLNQLEENKLVQVLAQNTSSKALRIKLELLFSKMKAALLARKTNEDVEVRFNNSSQKTADNVLQFETEKKKASITPDYIQHADKPNVKATSDYLRHDDKASATSDYVRHDDKGGAGSDYLQQQEEKVAKPANDLLLDKEPAPGHLEIPEAPVDETIASPLALPSLDRKIILLSPRDADMVFGAEIARRTQSSFHYFPKVNHEIVDFISRYPKSVVFWDIDHEKIGQQRGSHSAENVGLALSRITKPHQVFAISNEKINQLPYIFNYQRHVFSNFLFRADNPAALGVYSRVVGRVMTGNPFGTKKYFGSDARHQQISISQSSHRYAAVGATENFLTKNGLLPRLAIQAARAADELILNAVYDAPVDDKGTHYRKELDRSEEFSLPSRERVKLSVYQDENYYAISVRDQFGSLNFENLLQNLQKDYSRQSPSKEYGLGLNTVMSAGFSLLIAVRPEIETEVSIFFPNATSYREFRKQFRFLSISIISSDTSSDTPLGEKPKKAD